MRRRALSLLMVINRPPGAENFDSESGRFEANSCSRPLIDRLLLTAYYLAMAFHINARTSDCSSMTLVIGLPEP